MYPTKRSFRAVIQLSKSNDPVYVKDWKSTAPRLSILDQNSASTASGCDNQIAYGNVHNENAKLNAKNINPVLLRL